MSREIKFRCWDGKKMCKVEHPYLEDYEVSKGFILINGIPWYTRGEKYGKNLEIIECCQDFPLMQFTGLKDKNGKEIWEGDIIEVDWNDIRYSIHNFVIEWNEKYCSFVFEGGCPFNDKIHFKVIGNIYENPELLEKHNK